MNRRVAAVVVSMCAVGAGLFALTLGGERADGRELVALLDRGEKVTTHATYVLNLAGAPMGTTVVIELWRRDDRTRQNTTLSSPGQDSSTSLFFLPTGDLTCSSRGDETATCEPAHNGRRSAVDVLLGDLRTDLADLDVTVADEEVAGRPARCFTMPEQDRTARVCVLADGLPALVETSQGEMLLASVDDTIPDEVFIPPA